MNRRAVEHGYPKIPRAFRKSYHCSSDKKFAISTCSPHERLQYKPVTSLSGPTDPIPIHPLAQEGEGLDYECELVAVIGKVCRDVSEADALDHVFGYAVGNDVSHREWQIAKGGGQWSLGKGFDGVSFFPFLHV